MPRRASRLPAPLHGSGARDGESGCLTPLSSHPQWGGVVYADKSESLSIAGVDFINNRADISGSVLYLDGLRHRSSITAASFTGNTAGDKKPIQTDSPIDWDCR